MLSVLVGIRLGKPGGLWLFQGRQKFPSRNASLGVGQLDCILVDTLRKLWYSSQINHIFPFRNGSDICRFGQTFYSIR